MRSLFSLLVCDARELCLNDRFFYGNLFIEHCRPWIWVTCEKRSTAKIIAMIILIHWIRCLRLNMHVHCYYVYSYLLYAMCSTQSTHARWPDLAVGAFHWTIRRLQTDQSGYFASHLYARLIRAIIANFLICLLVVIWRFGSGESTGACRNFCKGQSPPSHSFPFLLFHSLPCPLRPSSILYPAFSFLPGSGLPKSS